MDHFQTITRGDRQAATTSEMEPLLPGGRFGETLRYGALRLLGTANGARWHRVCGGYAVTLHRVTYNARWPA